MTGSQARTSSQLPLQSTGKLNDSSPSWWFQRTRLERVLCPLSVAALLACLVLAIALTVIVIEYEKAFTRDNFNAARYENGVPSPPLPSKNLCLTKGCIKSASSMLENMDSTIDPCVDFFQFSCGGFLERTVIPEDKTSLSMFVVVEEGLKGKLKGLIEKPKTSSEPESFWKVKDLYKACLNKSEIDAIGGQPMKDLLSRLGGWPVVEGESWDEAAFDLHKLIYKSRAEGVSVDYLFDLSVSPDLKNTTRYIIELDQPSFGMPNRNYLLKGFNDTLVQAYYTLMVKSAVLLGATKEIAERELKQMLEFEIAMAEFALPKEERRDHTKLYNKMSLEELNNLSDKIRWFEYFNTLIQPNIRHDEPVVVAVPKYITQVMDLVQKTPKRTVANYWLWRTVLSSLAHLDTQFRTVRMEYIVKLTGQAKEQARWLHCMDIVNSGFSSAVAAMYVRKYFHQDAKTSAQEMITAIRNEFGYMLKEIDWMDPVTLLRAKEKLTGMDEHIAYPDELLNDRKVDEHFQNITIVDNKHFGNLMNIRKFSMNYSYGMLRKPVDKRDWLQHSDAAAVNAYYNPSENSIQFPAGILQGVFFGSDRPKYLNYGAIGFVIGHEITHGFDDQGRQFDKDGNLNSWWKPQTDKMFQEKAKCIIYQYGNYTVEEINTKLNGINTQGENIADNGGLKQSYRAYLRWINQNGPEEYLPGLPYTPRQLFWMSAANVWCHKDRPESLALRVMTGYHSPGRFRVNGVLSNLPEFSKDFGCARGSPMNPVKKCSVW